jgi:spore maturation protein CgeB
LFDIEAAKRPGGMTERNDDLVFIGLSLSSSWGNGHASTYRALLRGLAAVGRKVLFLERDVPWYAANRDLPSPEFCELAFYSAPDDLMRRFGHRIAKAGAVVVGSYVPNGVEVLDTVLKCAGGVTAFYDIDTPITLAALNDGTNTYLAARQIPRLDLYFSFTGGPILQRLAQIFGARRPRALYCAVDQALCQSVEAAPRWDFGYLGTYSPDRQPALRRLLLEPALRLPQMRFVVAGPQYPMDIEWPANVERIEHLAPGDHVAFYTSQRFTLNVTRTAMIAAGWSPSVRLFEAACCGVAVISDRWPGLAELLPEQEAILIADDTDDVIAALTGVAEPDRLRLGQCAKDIILRGHTGAARAQELLQHVDAVAGGEKVDIVALDH